MAMIEMTQAILDSVNIEQQRDDNRANLERQGGIDGFVKMIGLNVNTGLSSEQVISQREKFGTNVFPESPLSSYLELLLEALSDTMLLILVVAAVVALVIGILFENPATGWVEGTAILIAVFLVSNITAANNYSKQLQFRELESTSADDERVSVLRNSNIDRINPKELVVGDVIVLQAGDSIPADCILVSKNAPLANESTLTGEPDDLKKSREKDCFLLSSCLLTDGEETHAMVIGIGPHSQWGKIKANLVTEAINTPLQDKLEEMTTRIGYVGIGFAAATFIVLFTYALTGDQAHLFDEILHAFILAVTVVVVAIPEGLPLAVTISLAYSTKQMYEDKCLIRVLAACETMGNATNICSDKTGTLTENLMTVVEGWFADVMYDQETFASSGALPDGVKQIMAEHISVNRTAYLVYKDEEGKVCDRPQVIGNKTEGSLMLMIKNWGFDYEAVQKSVYHEGVDKVFAFNSAKKRSTCVLHRDDGSVRLYCKGASEWVLKDCTMYLDSAGEVKPLVDSKRQALEEQITEMADRALRTLVLAHKDFSKASELPAGWEDQPPDDAFLCVDCIVGIIDPLRPDVKEAVRIAQRAGVVVRMVTGDNIATARAIARSCGILTPQGLALEGPDFRKMTPAEVDAVLPRLEVLARSSPDDKYLLVTRLNGHNVPDGKEEWEEKFKGREGVTWEKDRDLLLPGYREEWEATRPDGGQVVGVTGDGTNDAPALKAADVGLAMGITGTKVAQGAADIVIMDDKFSSIVRAILWGRSVYDNIRKFLQFQLCVNIVALITVFIAALAGIDAPLNAVQLLWVNLVMDTMGALALGTEAPTPDLLERKPYKRSASLISRPMARNILCQSGYQLILVMILLFFTPQIFNRHKNVVCDSYEVQTDRYLFDINTLLKTTDTAADTITCRAYETYCRSQGIYCLEGRQNIVGSKGGMIFGRLIDFQDFEKDCLGGNEECKRFDFTHGTLIFNTFIWCQIFNEYTSRKLYDEVNMFEGVWGNMIFLGVSIFTIGAQIFLVEAGGVLLQTSSLTLNMWIVNIAMGAGSLIIGMLMRFIPVVENPDDFFDNETGDPMLSIAVSSSSPTKKGYVSPFHVDDDNGATQQQQTQVEKLV